MKNTDLETTKQLFKEHTFEDCQYCVLHPNGHVHRYGCPCCFVKKIGCRLYYRVWRRFLLWRQ
jgi:hypothetical protein